MVPPVPLATNPPGGSCLFPRAPPRVTHEGFRLSHSPLRHTLPLLVLVLSAPRAWGQTEPTALHSCAVKIAKGIRADAPSLADGCARVLEETLAAVPSEQVRAQVTGSGCAQKKPAQLPACLGALAKATGAGQALLITLSASAAKGKGQGEELRVEGLVVDASNTPRPRVAVTQRLGAGQTWEELARAAVGELLQKELSQLPRRPAPVVTEERREQPAPVAMPGPVNPPPAPTPEPGLTPPPPSPATSLKDRVKPPAGRTLWTPVAYGAGAVGVAAGIAAVVFGVQASNDYDTLAAKYANGAAPSPGELNEVVALRESIARKRELSTAGAIGGALLLGSGVAIWLWDSPGDSRPGKVSLTVGPGGVGLHGRLP